jgi:hypothetical protein
MEKKAIKEEKQRRKGEVLDRMTGPQIAMTLHRALSSDL